MSSEPPPPPGSSSLPQPSRKDQNAQQHRVFDVFGDDMPAVVITAVMVMLQLLNGMPLILDPLDLPFFPLTNKRCLLEVIATKRFVCIVAH